MHICKCSATDQNKILPFYPSHQQKNQFLYKVTTGFASRIPLYIRQVMIHYITIPNMSCIECISQFILPCNSLLVVFEGKVMSHSSSSSVGSRVTICPVLYCNAQHFQPLSPRRILVLHFYQRWFLRKHACVL